MKVVIQRVKNAKVTVDNKTVAEIQKGMLILLGISTSDTKDDIDYLINKIKTIRIFESDGKEFEKSIEEDGGEVLLVSQFTLYADTNKGRRPDFNGSAKANEAKELYEQFKSQLQTEGIKTKTGIFGADMDVTLTNNGPVTIIIESQKNE